VKRLIAASGIVFLFLIPFFCYGQSEQNAVKAPAGSPGLVREGNFALHLAEALKLGTAKNEAEAESMLALADIAPKNGWITDYPLTADMIGEVRKSISVALDSGKIAMNKNEALLAVQVLIDSQWKSPAAPSKEQAREYGDNQPTADQGYDPYDNPEPYYSPYYVYSPYPSYYGYYPFPYLYPYPYFRGGFVIRGFRGGRR